MFTSQYGFVFVFASKTYGLYEMLSLVTFISRLRAVQPVVKAQGHVVYFIYLKCYGFVRKVVPGHFHFQAYGCTACCQGSRPCCLLHLFKVLYGRYNAFIRKERVHS
jgi:hypothetical protein